MKKKILIVYKDMVSITELKEYMESSCNEVILATSVEKALYEFINTEFCLVVIDADISMEDDHRLVKVIQKARKTPILILSSQTNHIERLETFRAGAHAYMGKPYSMEECMAQAESLMQLYLDLKPSSDMHYTITFGKDLIIDPYTRQVFLKGRELKITKKEFDLLLCLASNPGRVFSREQLYDHVWDELSAFNVDDVVKAHIKRLRQKLSDADIEYIKNIWGVGYSFRKEPDKE